MIPLMAYKYRFLIFVWLLAVILIVAIISLVYGKTSPQVSYGHYQLFYEQPRTVFYPLQGYDDLIACLIRYESSGNPEALGDSGKAKGILQFHESTFKSYCVEQYSFHNDIWDSSIQIDCAKEMLNENFNNIYHWTVWTKCI